MGFGSGVEREALWELELPSLCRAHQGKTGGLLDRGCLVNREEQEGGGRLLQVLRGIDEGVTGDREVGALARASSGSALMRSQGEGGEGCNTQPQKIPRMFMDKILTIVGDVSWHGHWGSSIGSGTIVFGQSQGLERLEQVGSLGNVLLLTGKAGVGKSRFKNHYKSAVFAFAGKIEMVAKKVDALEEGLEGEMNQSKTTVEERISSMEGQVADLRDMMKKMLETHNQTAASVAKVVEGKHEF
ncbi:hypothetical protein IEQ34_014396 [Dendrobium chrysotoxum]|uniref:Uncharacterized protein n=1 Tax=Dendrobium chrysotoxum TaxID=161865 RepID=A0AAV7GLA9_DENCH|nr:hypothetical protein IEQ34_014396 [Dendrobium chrysotoxum]